MAVVHLPQGSKILCKMMFPATAYLKADFMINMTLYEPDNC